MKTSLSKTAIKTFLEIVSKVPESNILKLDYKSGLYMALVVERKENLTLYGKYESAIYSFAHYYEQNGDLMSDPLIEFLHLKKEAENIVMPMYYAMDGLAIYQQLGVINYAENNEKTVLINKNAISQCITFSNQWMKNIRHQQKEFFQNERSNKNRKKIS